MTEKRYFKRIWGEEYYIFDSQKISEREFDEKVEYEDYQAFAGSLTGDEVVELLNELHEENQRFKQMKENGLRVLNFYEKKLQNFFNMDSNERQQVKDEIWIIREVLTEMEVLEDEEYKTI